MDKKYHDDFPVGEFKELLEICIFKEQTIAGFYCDCQCLAGRSLANLSDPRASKHFEKCLKIAKVFND